MSKRLKNILGQSRLERDFFKYHKKNPHIWLLFEHFTQQVLESGQQKFSAKAIFERIRWTIQIETKDPLGFKLQNSMTAYYARLWQSKYPNKANFFSTRKTVSEKSLEPYQQELRI